MPAMRVNESLSQVSVGICEAANVVCCSVTTNCLKMDFHCRVIFTCVRT